MQRPSDQGFYRGSNRILGGVCSGLAESFHVDPLWVRLAFVLLAFLQGIGVLLYVVLWLIMLERVPGQAAGRSGLDSMSADVKRAWADLRNQSWWGSRPVTSPSVAPTGSPAPPPPPSAPAPAPPAPSATTTRNNNALFLGLVLVVIGLAFLANNIGFTIEWGAVWPVVLIALGIVLLVRAMERKP